MRMPAPVRALGLALIVLVPRSAAADPVTITSGFVEISQLTLARGVLQGDAFSMTFGAEALVAPVFYDCFPCSPGTTVNLGASFNGPRAGGSAVVDGTTYPQVYFDGMTGTFASPSFVVTGESTFTATQPFSYTGVVSGYLIDPWVSGFTEPAFTRVLTGFGTASATFRFVRFDEGPNDVFFSVTNPRYDFGDAAPVPEPATMLLCGGGTAFLLLRRRLRAGAGSKLTR